MTYDTLGQPLRKPDALNSVPWLTTNQIPSFTQGTMANPEWTCGAMPDKMIAAKDAAEMLGVCTDTLYRQWRAWDLKAYRIGSGLKFKSSDIDTWIERRAA